MSERVSPKDRLLAEELLRIWNACNESGRMLIAPAFDTFNSSAKAMLDSLGMVWDVGHGYVFPWTDMKRGPFPMTGTRSASCSNTSLSTAHTWKMAGVEHTHHLVVKVIYVCEVCSSWTFHEMKFVGFRMSAAQDRPDETKESKED
jgi:hypothetical protein